MHFYNTIVGVIPNEFCYLTLDTLEFQVNDDLTCYPTCLSSVTNLVSGSIASGGACAATSQDIGVCSLASSTSISTAPSYSDWSCVSDAYPSSDPCLWNGITCSVGTNTIVSIDLESLSLTGT